MTQAPSSNEWYTPVDVIEAARRTMGSIDLDPFSCAQANEVVQAARYYAKEPKHRCAFENPWSGNTWMNPPYSRGLINRAVDCFTDHFVDKAEIPFAITLTPLSDAAWYHQLLDFASALCLLRGRLKHWGPLCKGKPESGKRAQCIMYFERVPMPFDLGVKCFRAEFSSFGKVVRL